MKKKAGKPKGGNGQDKKKPSRKDIPGAGDLLRIANHLSGQAMKAEKIEAWQAKCEAQARLLVNQLNIEVEQGKNSGVLTIKVAQLMREAGRMDDNVAFALFYHGFIRMKEEKDAIPDHPAMQEVMDRCQEIDMDKEEEEQEYGKAWLRCRFASVLRHFGEYEFASLALNDRDAANQRIKDGLLRFFKDAGPYDDDFFKEILL
jgi:hypothetical protein